MNVQLKSLMMAVVLGIPIGCLDMALGQQPEAAAQATRIRKVRADVGANCECKDGVCKYLVCMVYVDVTAGPVTARLEAERLFRDEQGRQGNRIKGEIRVTIVDF